MKEVIVCSAIKVDGVGSNYDGGNINIVPGEGIGTGTDGNVGIGVIDPHSKLEVNGAITSKTKTITTSGTQVDVSDVNTVFLDIASDSHLGGCTGGVLGQHVNFVYKGNFINSIKFHDQDGTADQDFYMHSGGDEIIDSGGVVLACDGSDWYDCSHAKHVQKGL